jgi:hypothetical protein
MHQNAPPSQLLLNQVIELREILGDILRFHIEQRIDDVVDG